MYNLDKVCGKLSNRSTHCRGLLDAAWWIEDDGELERGTAAGFHLWNGSSILAPCVEHKTRQNMSDHHHLCLFGPHLAPHVQTPFMVQIEQFDYFQLSKAGVEGVDIFWGSSGWKKASFFQHQVRKTLPALPSPHTAFSATMRGHCLAETDLYWRVRLAEGPDKGLSFEAAMRQSLRQTASRIHVDDCGLPNCSTGCPLEPSLIWLLKLLPVAAITICLWVSYRCCVCMQGDYAKVQTDAGQVN